MNTTEKKYPVELKVVSKIKNRLLITIGSVAFLSLVALWLIKKK
jgi:hypothetical protein